MLVRGPLSLALPGQDSWQAKRVPSRSPLGEPPPARIDRRPWSGARCVLPLERLQHAARAEVRFALVVSCGREALGGEAHRQGRSQGS